MARSLYRHFANVRTMTSAKEGERRGPSAEWVVPDASMFFWVKLHLPVHGLDITAFVRDTAVPHGILVLPGSAAFPEERKTACVRLSFSLLSDEEMEKGVRRLAKAVVSLSNPGVSEKDSTEGRSVPIMQGDGAANCKKTRGSEVCVLQVATQEEAEELAVHPRSVTGPTDFEIDVKPSPPPPSSFSNHSSESGSTLHPLDTPTTITLAEKRQSPSGEQFSIPNAPDKSSIAFPESTQCPGQTEPLTHKFATRLRRASSTIGLKFRSLTRSPSTARLTERVLKIRTSVVGIRGKAHEKGTTGVA